VFSNATMYPYVTVLKPDGTTLKASWYLGSAGTVGNLTLPSTGTYTIKLDPNGSGVGSATVRVS
jgi:hypothetical protein